MSNATICNSGYWLIVDGHQSYPGILHGGIISAILDETIGLAIMITEENVLGVTVELKLKSISNDILIKKGI